MKNKKEKILFFTNELAIMLKSGLTFTTAIEIILKEEKDKNFKEVLKKIHKNLIAGKSIFESFKNFEKIFGNTYLYMLKIGEVFPKRDVFDMELYKTAIKLKKPIFGICRGYQIINVINGGTLYQDLSYADFVKIKHDQVDNPTQATHFVELEEGTFLKNILGKEYKVNSFHHQIIKDVAPEFKVVAKSSDGVVESIEKITEDSFIIGVQWHPEMLSLNCEKSQEIFNSFVRKVIEYKK